MEKKSYGKITIEAPGCEAKVSLGKIRSSIMAQSLSAERLNWVTKSIIVPKRVMAGVPRLASFGFIAYEQSSCVNVPEIYYPVY